MQGIKYQNPSIEPMKILLVEPSFPIPKKSKNHKNFLPIGLLKLASYYRRNGNYIKLVRGNLNVEELRFKPDQIMVTSLFTYWSRYVKESVEHYKKLYPKTKVIVGGIYASLMPKHCKKYTGCDKVFRGIHKKAEKYAESNKLDYALVNNPHPINYQIIHASRGCFRKCDFCGVWKIEPRFTYKRNIKNEISSNKLIFYDNNLLANPYIENILLEIASMRLNGKPIICESQSGFDGRVLISRPKLAKLIKKARFINLRIAWDNNYSEWRGIKKQIDILVEARYPSKEIYVFMLYNFDHNFKEMERKRLKCWEWNVQIADCRYRPLDQTYDNYNSKRKQTKDDYYIHEPIWTDKEVKQFRRNVRRQNICVRHGFSFYSRALENKIISKVKVLQLKNMSKNEAKKILPDAWFPEESTPIR